MHRLSLLIVAPLVVVVGALAAQEPSALPEPGDPPARVARLAYLEGSVSFQPSGDTAWSMAQINYPMTTGDRLYADQGGRAELQLGRLTLRVSDATDLTVTNLTDDFAQVGLAQGTLRVSIYELPPGDQVEIDTPYGALQPLAVGEYRIDLPPDNGSLVAAAYRGTMQWVAGGIAQLVQGGQAISVSGVSPLRVARAALPAPDDFDRWSAERDRGYAASGCARYMSRDIPGCADLDGAGIWETGGQWGPVWYPTALPAGWAPYRHGRWVWIEPWGWTWVEREPWGYAPFHYGRWVFVGSRWGWAPGVVVGRPYYAPALVVFVDGSGLQAGAQGWFPLGPGEPYHPWYHGGDAYVRHVNAVTWGHMPNLPLTTRATTIQYRNRRVATTVVPRTTFMSGLPISHRVISVTGDQVMRAPIAPHPVVMPGASAAGGGNRAPEPPRRRRPTFVVTPKPRPTPPVQPNKPIIVPRATPVPPAPPAPRNQPGQPPRPVLITREPPPPQQPPFPERQKAMQPDPGKPLEPQQINNLREGKPAGPPRGQERPAPQARPTTPRVPPTPAPGRKPAGTPQAPTTRAAPAAPKQPRSRRDTSQVRQRPRADDPPSPS
jgi:Family of unknown function (DUF6600)